MGLRVSWAETGQLRLREINHGLYVRGAKLRLGPCVAGPGCSDCCRVLRLPMLQSSCLGAPSKPRSESFQKLGVLFWGLYMGASIDSGCL